MRGHAQWWNPELKPREGASRSPGVEGAGAAISASVADERNRAQAQKLSEEAESVEH